MTEGGAIAVLCPHPDEAVFCGGTIRARAAELAAFAAHASQLPAHSETMRPGAEAFTAVYGPERFNRRGPAGVLDDLA